MAYRQLPLPPHFDPARVGSIWRVPYSERATQAEQWRAEHRIAPTRSDPTRIGVLAVDMQNTFCLPGFELFVAGPDGRGAVEDSRRFCEFLYRNLGVITEILVTLDTHTAFQIFHPMFLIDPQGCHPAPFTEIGVEEVEQGHWRFNPELAPSLGIEPRQGQRHLRHYVRALRSSGKYALIVWPYHSMLGGIGHALVSAVEEAIFFHGVARRAQADFRVKGRHPLTEHYSVLGPEVTTGPDGEPIAQRDAAFIERLLSFDALVIAGQAKSHCVAWTVADLLAEMGDDRRRAGRVYLLEDCSSPVVIPGTVDFSERADAAYRRFAEAGMHVVRSSEPMDRWPGLRF